jgi:exosortase
MPAPAPATDRDAIRTFLYVFGGLSAVVIWSYWSTLDKAANRWNSDIQYSHGWLIPLFCVYLLFVRRNLLEGARLEPSWWGLAFLVPAVGLRFVDVVFYYNFFDPFSLIPMLMGLAVAVGGWAAFRWCWPAAAFLVFMVPLPYFLHTGMSTRLQGMATQISVAALQTAGYPAVGEGTQLKIDDANVSVAEACSGLGMIVTFVALSVAVVLLVKSPWWTKVGLLLGSIPVAIICNVVRISAVAAYKSHGADHAAVETFHDICGYVMFALGLALIFVELYVLDRIVMVQDSARRADRPLPLPFSAGGKTVRPAV